jgi:hypothetical protein
LRPAQKQDSCLNQIENNDANCIASDNSRSKTENISSDTTNIVSGNEVKCDYVRDVRDVGDVVQKARLDSQGNSKGHFTKDDWIYILTMLPRQHPLFCDEDEAGQTLYALIEEGKVQEILGKPGTFEPTSSL